MPNIPNGRPFRLKTLLNACLALLMLTAVGSVQAAIPAQERAVLVALYESTHGAGWTNNRGWLGAVGTECSWIGVTCNRTSAVGVINAAVTEQVISIQLIKNNLIGTLPVTLNNLTALQSFSVYDNQLSGSIPALSGLTALQGFSVNNNQLSGSIPVLSGLTALQDFDVASNKLSGTIPVLTGLTALHSFYVFSNQLSGSIPALSGLTALQFFSVSSNQLSGSIPALSGLTALRFVDVQNNQLSGSIPVLSGLTALRSVDVHNNQLSGSIPALSGLTELRAFYVYNNQLSGSIPAAPTSLLAKNSTLCPNQLTPSVDTAWDIATGETPWSAKCAARAVSTTPLLAAFTVGSGRTTLSILVNAAPSTGAGSLASYVWSSADGQTANGKTATFTFAKAGVYDISLTVTDSQGATANLKKQVIVAPVPLLASASYNARNNIPAEALPVLINDSPVQQVFLTPNDVDWYEFYAKAGKNYTIELPKERIGAAINPAVQVYDKSGNALTALITQTAQKQGISVVFNAPSTGLFRLRVSNQPPFARSNAVADNTYQLRILLTDAPLQGIIKGSVISACDLLGIRQADVSAWLAGALTDSTPTHKTGEYGLELNPDQYAIKSIAEQFTPIEQPVTLSQTAISVLNFNQTPAAGCQSVTLPVPDPLLPLPDPLLLLQQQAVAFYNDLTGQLIVRDVWSGNDVYYAELQNVGDYHFQLTRADIIGGTMHLMPGYYGFTPFIANLPNVFAFGKLWTVQLKNQGDWLFTVEKAE